MIKRHNTKNDWMYGLSSERLASIIDRSGLGFWCFKPDQDHYFSPRTFQILGLESNKPSLENFVSKIFHEDLEKFQESNIGTVIKSWVPAGSDICETIEFRIKSSNELKHIKCSGSIECDAEGIPRSVSGYLEDVSAIKEKELQDLMHLSKMAVLGQMTSAIVHEINNPLSVLINYALYLKGLSPLSLDTEVFHRCVEGISKNSNRIAEIVRSIKFFTGGGAVQCLEISSLKTILQETFNICQENIKWGFVKFEIDCDEKITVECRPIQISQVLINLISNSVMAINQFDEKWIKINAIIDKDIVKIFVMDSGNGISESIAKSMTKAYFTTKNRKEGAGIGLTICKAIAERHHGRLYYDATSKNTLFVLELPIRQPDHSKCAKETKSLL